MDPAQGETQGKSLTSKLKAKVKGVKGKVHLPGHKKRQAGAAQGGDTSDSSSSDDDSPQKPGPETGYNLGDSTPYTTVKNTSPPPRETHDRDYEAPSPPPTMEEKNDYTNETGQQPYATSTTEGASAYSEPPSSPSQAPAPGILGHVKQSMGGAAAAVGSKMGYYTEVESTPHVQAPHDPNAPTMMEKTKAALGMDKPSDPNAPTMMEKTKAAMGMDKPSDPNAPTMMEKTKATLGMGPSSPSTGAANQQPGIVDRVSGAVSSLFNSSPKETGEDVQHTFPAHSDDVPKAADHGVDEKMTTSSSPAYKTPVY